MKKRIGFDPYAASKLNYFTKSTDHFQTTNIQLLQHLSEFLRTNISGTALNLGQCWLLFTFLSSLEHLNFLVFTIYLSSFSFNYTIIVSDYYINVTINK